MADLTWQEAIKNYEFTPDEVAAFCIGWRSAEKAMVEKFASYNKQRNAIPLDNLEKIL